MESRLDSKYTIQKIFLIWISRSFKKGASDNTISYFDQSFWFSNLLPLTYFWPEIWEDLVKISRGEQRENMFFFFNFWTVNGNFFIKSIIFFYFFRTLWNVQEVNEAGSKFIHEDYISLMSLAMISMSILCWKTFLHYLVVQNSIILVL